MSVCPSRSCRAAGRGPLPEPGEVCLRTSQRGDLLRPRLLRLAALGAILGVLGPVVAAETPEQLLAGARQAMERKEYRSARRLAERVVSRHAASPVVVDAWLVAIDARIAQQSWVRAFEECEKLLAAHPQAPQRTAVLRREVQIGEAIAASHVNLLLFRLKRLEEGVKVLERVIEHAPFGPLADRALYAIGEAYFKDGDYQAAHDAYERLLKQYPNSDLVIRARVRRATANQRLAEGPAYDLAPAQAARRDMEDLARQSGSERVAGYARDLRDVMARSDYDSGLFYFNRFSIDGGVRYMKAVMARYPDSEYAERAERILALVKRLTADAQSEGAP
ncbi:MAG: outer membrane protein assembly factor BamD [Planctomycetes bacterium]|nr:outer membrane protein assembly factor BamD [Planctomycetota bacterium]